MMKKFVSLLLACLMVFNLLGITAFAAEDPVVITMDVDAASVKVGDIVSVTVSADKELANMNAWGYDIYVDTLSATVFTPSPALLSRVRL